jgi:hypothetical protein
MADADWDTNGNATWIGPRDLRYFLRANRFLVSYWTVGLMFLSWGFWVDAADLGALWLSVPLGVVTGGFAALALTFGFSRGWISEGD